MKKIVFILGIAFSGIAYAGCGESTGQCYYYKAGELIKRASCKVSTCASAAGYFYSTWEWKGGNKVNLGLDEEGNLLVNDKLGFTLQLDVKADGKNLYCYGVKDTDELLCADSGM